MKQLQTLRVALLCFAASPLCAQEKPPEAPAETVTLKKIQPTVGDIRDEAESFSVDMSIKLNMNGQLTDMNQKSSEKKARKTEILALAEGKISKVKVSFGDLVKNTEGGPEGPEDHKSAVSGNSYIIEKTTDGHKVTDGEGKDVSEEIQDEAIAAAKNSFEDNPLEFAKVIPDRALKVGEVLEVPADVAEKIFDADGQLKVKKMTLTLKAVRKIGESVCVAFDVFMDCGGEPGDGAKLGLELKGELLIEQDTCWPRSLSLEGPMSVSQEQQGEGMTMSVEGKGKFKSSMAGTYSRKKADAKEPAPEAPKEPAPEAPKEPAPEAPKEAPKEPQ